MQPKRRGLAVIAVVASLFLVVVCFRCLFNYEEAKNSVNSFPVISTQNLNGSVDAALERSATTFNSGGAGRLARSTANAPNMSPSSSSPALRLSAVAPLDLQVGQVSEIRIDLQADEGVRELMFDVAFDKKRLTFVGSSEGNLIRQSGLSDAFAVEEPSDGNVHVSVRPRNAPPMFGNGTVAVLRVEGIKAGTSQITLQNVSALDSGGAGDSIRPVLYGSVVSIH